jgi:hypothetical protein
VFEALASLLQTPVLQGDEPFLKGRANLGRRIRKSQEQRKQIQRQSNLLEHFKQAASGRLRPAIYNVPDAWLELQRKTEKRLASADFA